MEIDARRILLNQPPNKILNFEQAMVTRDSSSIEIDTKRNWFLVKVCFSIWKRKVKEKKHKEESVKQKLEQREKIDNLIKALKQHKKSHDNENKNETQMKPSSAKLHEVNVYKKRFEAQKTAIERLTMKLEEKDRVIEDLKLGILHKDALKAIDDTKIEIREIFGDCSAKVRLKVAPPPDFSEKFMVSTQKAPKIIQIMEERAMERAHKHQIIQERKRLIEEKRKRMLAEALEKKRAQDEEEKKRNLEIMKERRRKELELEKVRQANKLIFLERLNKAVDFHKRKLLKKGLEMFIKNRTTNRNNYIISECHYKAKLMKKVLLSWIECVEDQYKEKYQIADAHFAEKILMKTFLTWHEFYINGVRNMQVAEDFYDYRLQNKIFIHWHRQVCVEILAQDKKMKQAQKHHQRRILIQYFYQWRSLPAVMQLEKAKEQKKRKWREKVREILPDYKPPDNSFLD